MDRTEFRNEVVKSELCPIDFIELYNEFAELQDKNLEVLNEVHRICEEHGVNYEMAFGSLIGAVRDNGIIPWDYDIDIFIPYQEKNKFINALKENLSDNYYFQCKEVDNNCRHYGMRIAPKGFDLSNVHVDVFYYIGLPQNWKKLYICIMQVLFQWRYYKKVVLRDIKNMSKKHIIFVLMCKALLFFIPMLCIDNGMHKLCNKYDINKAEFCTPVFNVYKNLIYSSDSITKTKLLDTDLGVFRIPCKYDIVLSTLYGNYKRIYPLKLRIGEFLGNYNHLTGSNKVFKEYENFGRYYI